MFHFSLKSDITLSLNHFSGSSSFAFTVSILSYSTSFLFLQQAKSLTISGLLNSLAPLSSTSGFSVAVLFSSFRSYPNHLLIKTFLIPTQSSSLLLVTLYPTSIFFFTTSISYCIYHFILLCVHCWCFFPSPHPQLDHNPLRRGMLLAIFYWCVSRA